MDSFLLSDKSQEQKLVFFGEKCCEVTSLPAPRATRAGAHVQGAR